jgi:rRNA pseudouridine-1189 N-methylase Emg1 (Nep1/Mra1 family)
MPEGRPPKEYATFTSLVEKLLTVSKADLDVRVSEAKEKAALNPRKRGPKPKVKTS